MNMSKQAVAEKKPAMKWVEVYRAGGSDLWCPGCGQHFAFLYFLSSREEFDIREVRAWAECYVCSGRAVVETVGSVKVSIVND